MSVPIAHSRITQITIVPPSHALRGALDADATSQCSHDFQRPWMRHSHFPPLQRILQLRRDSDLPLAIEQPLRPLLQLSTE